MTLTQIAARAAALLGILFATSTGLNAESPKLVKVEEDWVLVVKDGNPETSAPHIVTYMTPSADRTGDYFMLTMNHTAAPSFAPGNMQVQRYSRDRLTGYQPAQQVGKLALGRETVRWTQRLEMTDIGVQFSITNGKGRSYGHFGNTFSLTTFLTTLDNDLSDYRYGESTRSAKIEFASNRVDSFKLTKVRYYFSDGSVKESTLNVEIKK